jgi:hypothetical protein
MRKTLILAYLALSMLASSTPAEAQSADDKAMAQYIGGQLKQSGQLRDYRIGVKYQDGVAWLSGSVTDQQQLGTAMRLAGQVSGVEHVVNNLTVSGNSLPASGTQPRELGPSLTQASQLSTGFNRSSVHQAFAKPMARPQAASRPMAAKGYRAPRHSNMPRPMHAMPVRQASARSYGPMPAQQMSEGMVMGGGMAGMDAGAPGPAAPMAYVPGGGTGAVSYDNAQMPGYAWPSYASYPNYAALSYPQQYSPTAWPYIGPFYPYPQVPLGWRKVALEWDDGWWFLDFSDCGSNH